MPGYESLDPISKAVEGYARGLGVARQMESLDMEKRLVTAKEKLLKLQAEKAEKEAKEKLSSFDIESVLSTMLGGRVGTEGVVAPTDPERADENFQPGVQQIQVPSIVGIPPAMQPGLRSTAEILSRGGAKPTEVISAGKTIRETLMGKPRESKLLTQEEFDQQVALAGAKRPVHDPKMTETTATELMSMGVAPSQASPAQIQEAINRIQSRRVSVAEAQAGARVSGAKEAERQQPVGAKATDYVNPQTFQAPPPDMKLGDVIAGGYVKVSQKQKERLQGLGEVSNIIQQADALSSQIVTAENWGAAMLQGPSLQVGATTRSNPLATTYAGQKEAFTGVLSRTLGGEKGVLTDRDISRISNMLPSFFDTKEVRDLKMGLVKLTLNQAVDSQRRVLVGDLDTSKVQSANASAIDGAIAQIVDKQKQSPKPKGTRIAINPQTGERMIERNGKWEPLP